MQARIRPPRTDRWPAARVFRLLASKAPRLPIGFRFSAAPDAALAVRGLRGIDFLEIHDAVRGAPEAVRGLRFVPMMLEAALVPNAPTEALAALEERELWAAWSAVSEALNIVSPIRETADVDAWEAFLFAGARENGGLVGRMADCLDVSVGFGGVVRIPRPDRFYGIPVCDMTDGQIMAFGAGYRMVHK